MDQGTGRYRGYIILCSVISLIVGGAIVYLTARPQKSSVPIVVSTPLPTSPPPSTPTPAPIRVYVSGAVQEPAVYELPPGSIVQDAIEAAGGPALDAALEQINLALELQGQQQVHVPRLGETNLLPSVSGGAAKNRVTTGGVVNINTATAAELETLPGVGPVTAQDIVEYRETHRPFETIEEIQDVPGIGPKTFAGMEEMITVGP